MLRKNTIPVTITPPKLKPYFQVSIILTLKVGIFAEEANKRLDALENP